VYLRKINALKEKKHPITQKASLLVNGKRGKFILIRDVSFSKGFLEENLSRSETTCID
jgi:hypothetical protein